MITVTKKFTFDAAHRLVGHKGACKHLHGHTYSAEVEISGPLDSLGMVIDFGIVKEKIGEWIKQKWDHNTILNVIDPLVDRLFFEEKKPFVMTCNPTAENMSRELLHAAVSELPMGYNIVRVRIYEGENSWAEVINK
jgi:6-pyruvoyltetrahydropterin/6-carboxytetrahydropterin synthase